MTGKNKRLIGLVLAVSLLLTIAGCSKDENPADEQQPETQTEEQAAESTETTDYDIASNLKQEDNGDEKSIDTDYLTIKLTHGSSWDYTIDSNTSITIYNTAASEANCGGRLVSIVAYDSDDKGYEMLPSYNVIGEKNGMVYIAEYPSDVQFDPSDERAAADYQAVFKEVNKIREGAADSPLILK